MSCGACPQIKTRQLSTARPASQTLPLALSHTQASQALHAEKSTTTSSSRAYGDPVGCHPSARASLAVPNVA